MYRYREGGTELHKRDNKVGYRGTAGPEKVKYYLLWMESPVKGEDMKQGELHNMKISETSEFRSFPEMENIGKSGVSGNQITSK